MTIHETGAPLPNYQTCDDCANPMWCRIRGACQGCHHPPIAERKQAEMDAYMATMRDHGLRVEIAADGVCATGTRDQWLEFLNALEETYGSGNY